MSGSFLGQMAVSAAVVLPPCIVMGRAVPSNSASSAPAKRPRDYARDKCSPTVCDEYVWWNRRKSSSGISDRAANRSGENVGCGEPYLSDDIDGSIGPAFNIASSEVIPSRPGETT
jgi:hypothetical protein